MVRMVRTMARGRTAVGARRWRAFPLAALLLAFVPGGSAASTSGSADRQGGAAQPAPSPAAMGPVWPKLTAAERDDVMQFGEDFKQFMGVSKSELFFVREARQFAERHGFTPWRSSLRADEVTPGSRWYAVNRDRTIALFVIGRRPMTDGARIVNSHIDAVRIELKTKPFRTSQDIALLDTQVHGGLKNYQWVNRPLALIGRIDKTDGTTVWVDIGHGADDPVLLIPDLAPHVDADYRERKNRDVIRTEELDPLLGMAMEAALEVLRSRYGVTSDDLLSAELQLVPAQMPVDIGLDRQLVGAYGHDDRSNGYASLRAIAEVETPDRTAIAYAVNNEEVSSWTTGVNSEWFSTLFAEIVAVQATGTYSDLMLRHALAASQVLVSDCTTAVNPLFPGMQLPGAAARLGWGLVFKEYGSGREADSEYMAEVRAILDAAGVRWQTHSYQAGYGGGTIAQWFANANMDAIDVGIGILSMHSPFDVSAKVDLWELYRGFRAFMTTSEARPRAASGGRD